MIKWTMAALLTSMVGACASAPETAASSQAAAGDPERVVCTSERVSGSNRPERVCLTVKQRGELRDRAEQERRKDEQGVERPAPESSGPQ